MLRNHLIPSYEPRLPDTESKNLKFGGVFFYFTIGTSGCLCLTCNDLAYVPFINSGGKEKQGDKLFLGVGGDFFLFLYLRYLPLNEIKKCLFSSTDNARPYVTLT